VVATTTSRTRHPQLVHALWIAPFVLLALPSLPFLWHQWTRSVWSNSHGMLMPLLVAYLAVRTLRRSEVEYEEPSAAGFAILLPALALLVLDGALRTDLLAVVALLLALPGLSLLTLGPRRTRALLIPWLISFLMLPIPDGILGPIHVVLRRLTATGTEWLLHTLGFPAYRDGFTLLLPRNALYVADECSGFSTLYATVTIALILAYLCDGRVRRLLVLALAAPLAMACNVLRVSLLALLVDRYGAGILESAMHPTSGWITFMIAAGVLFFIAEADRRRPPD
jgi:exosortase